MRATFLGAQKHEYTNRNTGEVGHEHVVQLDDGKGARLLRVPEADFTRYSDLPRLSEVEVVVGFERGQYGKDWLALRDLRPVSGPKS